MIVMYFLCFIAFNKVNSETFGGQCVSGNVEYCMVLGFGMLTRPSHDSVSSVGGARRPESSG